MENTSICIETLINNITLYLSGNNCTNSSVIKVNNDCLSTNGDLCFLHNLKVWREVFQGKDACNGKCTTVLQHFFHMQNKEIDDKTTAEIADEVLTSLILASKNWPIQIEKYFLEKERICLFLQRVPIIKNAIRTVIEQKQDFGRSSLIDKVFSLRINEDKESQLTTARLCLIRNITRNILELHGCNTDKKDANFKIVFTSKSEGRTEDGYEKYVCGVVKNYKSNTKETQLTWEEYIQNKLDELEILNDQKKCETNVKNVVSDEQVLENIAKAAATFELLSMKPNRTVLIGCKSETDRSITNTKGAPFVLYNYARIAAIIGKYDNRRLAGEYPDLPDIDDVNFSLLDQEEEWELVYNFIIGYREIIKDCIKYEPVFQTNPQVLCIFLSRLCQKFSVYYRRIRILTEAYDHLIPTMTARLFMLRALQIVLQNALKLTDIVLALHM